MTIKQLTKRIDKIVDKYQSLNSAMIIDLLNLEKYDLRNELITAVDKTVDRIQCLEAEPIAESIKKVLDISKN